MSPSRGENDNERAVATAFGASVISLFLPPILLFGLTALLAFALFASGHGISLIGGGFAGLLMMTLLLSVRALLRLQTVSVRFEPGGLMMAPGFPSRGQFGLAWHDIADVHVQAGLAGRLTGARTLVAQDVRGRTLEVRDLADAEEAATLIRARIGQFQGVAALLGGLTAMGGRGRAGEA